MFVFKIRSKLSNTMHNAMTQVPTKKCLKYPQIITCGNDPIQGIVSQLFPATVILLSHLFGANWLTTVGCSIFANEPGPVHTGQRRNHLGNPSHRLSPNSRGRSHNAVFQQSSLHRWHKAVCHLERSILLLKEKRFFQRNAA